MSEYDSTRRSQALALAARGYLKQAKRDWLLAIPSLTLPGIGNVLVFYIPALVVARVLARYVNGQNPTLAELTPYLIAFGGVWIAGEALWRGFEFCFNRFIGRGMGRIYAGGMDALLAKDQAFFHDNFAGALTKKVLGHARAYGDLMASMSMSVFGNLIPLFFVIPALWVRSPYLIVVLVGMCCVTLAAILPLIRRRKRIVDERETASNRMAGHVADTLSNMEAVRAFAREDWESQVHTANVSDFMTKAIRAWDYQNTRINMVTSPLYVLTNVAGLAIAAAVTRRTGSGFEAVFLTFNFYANFTRVMWDFNNIYRNFETLMAEASQFTELLLEPPRVQNPQAPLSFMPDDTAVTFQNVTFRYHDSAGDHLFTNFNLDIRNGERVGLVGRSGGGKTTITKLLMRFVDVDSGVVSVGRQDISQVKQQDLRAMMAYVPQDPAMFHRSLMDNIRFGRLDATDDEVVDAAYRANADEFIRALPKGYDTLIGDRGVKLSGGQRQRVAIARAMLKGAPILILDEATSSLDSVSERMIQQGLWALMQGRTAIVIAHRLSTVQRMDRLIVVEEGRLVEDGTHAELLARGGAYARLWEHQTGAFLSDAPEAEETSIKL